MKFSKSSILSKCSRGQACSHVGALLFLIAEVIASGDQAVPPDDALSVTQSLCEWVQPKGIYEMGICSVIHMFYFWLLMYLIFISAFVQVKCKMKSSVIKVLIS